MPRSRRTRRSWPCSQSASQRRKRVRSCFGNDTMVTQAHPQAQAHTHATRVVSNLRLERAVGRRRSSQACARARRRSSVAAAALQPVCRRPTSSSCQGCCATTRLQTRCNAPARVFGYHKSRTPVRLLSSPTSIRGETSTRCATAAARALNICLFDSVIVYTSYFFDNWERQKIWVNFNLSTRSSCHLH